MICHWLLNGDNSVSGPQGPRSMVRWTPWCWETYSFSLSLILRGWFPIKVKFSRIRHSSQSNRGAFFFTFPTLMGAFLAGSSHFHCRCKNSLWTPERWGAMWQLLSLLCPQGHASLPLHSSATQGARTHQPKGAGKEVREGDSAKLSSDWPEELMENGVVLCHDGTSTILQVHLGLNSSSQSTMWPLLQRLSIRELLGGFSGPG